MAIEEIEIEGFVGQNPIYSSEKHPALLTFSVGVSQSRKNKETDEWETHTNWYNVLSWNPEKSTWLFNKLRRGDKVVVKGKPSLNIYTDKQGEAKGAISINMHKIALLQRKNDNTESDSLSESIPF